MSEIHQYEIRYTRLDNSEAGVKLEWAYSAQDALVQFREGLRPTGLRVVVMEIGPVKKAISSTPAANFFHFHICKECNQIGACTGCVEPYRSDMISSCFECLGKKPHEHHCGLCEKMYSCENLPCSLAHLQNISCKKHSPKKL